MNDQHGTLLTIFKHLKQAMDPLKEELSTPERALSFAISLGIELPAPPKSLISLKGDLTTLGDAYDALEELLKNGNEASAEAFLKLSSLSTALAGLVQHILRLPTDFESEYQAYSDLLVNIDFADLGRAGYLTFLS